VSQFYVGSIDERKFVVPEIYASHCEGYLRQVLVSHAISPASVHMGVGLVEIAPGGYHSPVMHAFEKSFYVLDGTVIASIGQQAYQLSTGHYGLIHKATPYTFCNATDKPVRLFEMMAPQPKPMDSNFRDTFFLSQDAPARTGPVPNLDDPRVKFLGKFDESQMPTEGGPISGVGARSNSIHGVILKEFVDRSMGAQHLSMFLVQFQPGGKGGSHDHPHEEIYYFLSGKAEAIVNGERFVVEAGQYVWTAVGCFHSFETVGDEPVRWIETQAPQPTEFEAFRFRDEWAHVDNEPTRTVPGRR